MHKRNNPPIAMYHHPLVEIWQLHADYYSVVVVVVVVFDTSNKIKQSH